jgi:hypothetical protein
LSRRLPPPDVTKLRDADGKPILVNGSAQLVHDLRARPGRRVSGDGSPSPGRERLRMFPDPAEMLKLRLADAKAHESGVALLIYEPAAS